MNQINSEFTAIKCNPLDGNIILAAVSLEKNAAVKKIFPSI
jgi:hypothetical protein